MNERFKLALVTLLFAATLLTAGCPQRQSISRIKDDPSRYRNKEVAIAGRVVDSYGLLGRGIYEVDDGTGSIWVVSQRRGVPSRGAQVGTKGHIYTGFSYGGRNFGTVLEETDRRIR